MGRYWWTVWIKVAILAVALILAYTAVSKYVKTTFEPYQLDEAAVEEIEQRREAEEAEKAASEAEEADDEDNEDDADAGQSATDKLKSIVEDAESKVGIYIDYENFIFDYANGYAQRMMEESEKERNVITEPLS